MADTLDLQKRIDGLTIAPKDLADGAADLIEEVASKKITGEEDRYSRTDLWDFQANVDGAQKIVTLLNPLIVKQDPSSALVCTTISPRSTFFSPNTGRRTEGSRAMRSFRTTIAPRSRRLSPPSPRISPR